jgi:hypothetical protein
MKHDARVRYRRVWFAMRGAGLLAALALLAAFSLPRPQLVHGQPAPQGATIDVKFRAGPVRLRDGAPVREAGAPADPQAAARLRRIGRWQRAHRVSEQDLERLRARAARAGGRPAPDLNLYFRVTLPPGADADRAIRELQQLPNVEAAYLAPRPAPLAAAPDYSLPPAGPVAPYQQYLDAAPQGIGARLARGLAGANGAGITVCDVEYSWNAAHTDLPAVTLYGPNFYDPFTGIQADPDNHGTAVMGVLGSKNNGGGSTGIAYDASVAFAAAQTSADPASYNVAAAITQCASNLEAGDVVLIEQQMYGPNSDFSGCNGCVPVEWYKPTYDAIRLVVAGGIVVVEAAANGAENLDAPIYSTGNGGHYPFLPANDSGALLVGAGGSPAYGDDARSAHDFSDYGATLDVQGWGDSVVTTGYGDLFSAEGKSSWFTSGFGGTSAASPVVAGAVAVVQGVHKERFGAPASPAKVRSLLRATGTPQTGPNTIGPLPNLQCALDSLLPLAISAPGSVLIGSTAPLTATIGAADVTQPITYTWRIDDSAPITITGDTSDVLRPLWSARGLHTVRVEARSGCGLPASDTVTVEVVGIAPASATIDGALRVLRGAAATYTATLAPLTASRPVTYTWQTSGQPPITHTAGISDSASFAWSAAGAHEVTLTVDNGWGAPLVASKTVMVGVPVADATVASSGEAVVGQTSSYTATVGTAGASLPISYTWQLDDAAPVTHSGGASDTFAVTWTRAGAHTLRITIANGWGAPVVLERAVDVRAPIFRLYLPIARR